MEDNVMIIEKTAGKHVCDLSDCFANKNDKCTLLESSVYIDCPFYKPIQTDVERYADIASYKYSLARIKRLEEKVNNENAQLILLKEEISSDRKSLREAKSQKERIKERIKRRLTNRNGDYLK